MNLSFAVVVYLISCCLFIVGLLVVVWFLCVVVFPPLCGLYSLSMHPSSAIILSHTHSYFSSSSFFCTKSCYIFSLQFIYL